METSIDLINPGRGVYFTRSCYKGMVYNSITNVGINPTFKDTFEIQIETHLLDFDEDIYGEGLEVKFLKKIRDEKKFSSVNDLVTQISKDIQMAREYFESIN